MNQTLLFAESEYTAPQPAGRFVFERLTAQDLFEQATALLLPEFVDSVAWRHGFSGTEKAREELVAGVTEKLLTRFMQDGDFAARVGASDDPRPELAMLLVRWMRK